MVDEVTLEFAGFISFNFVTVHMRSQQPLSNTLEIGTSPNRSLKAAISLINIMQVNSNVVKNQ